MSVAPPPSAPALAKQPRIASRPAPAASSSRIMAPRPPARPNAAASSSSSTASRATLPKPAASPAAAPTPTGASKDTSSSSGKVFAKPSKEWVLPERAKPGRKVSVEEPDSKRQSQNRLSQRAHRARRTDYISTLEDRIRQFENDEIHSNVRLQEVARALKADNERLKSEVLSLKTAQSQAGSPAPKGWEEERGMLLHEVRILRDELATLRQSGGTVNMRSLGGTPMPHAMIDGSGGERNLSCPICPNPDPDCPCQRTHIHAHHPAPPQYGSRTHAPDPSLPLGSAAISPMHEHDSGCGFCASTDECLCRAVEIPEEEDVKPIILTPPTASMRLEDSCGLCADGGFCACAVARNSPTNSTTTTSSGRAAVNAVSSGVWSVAPAAFASGSGSGAAQALPLRKRAISAKKSLWAIDSGITPAGPSTAASRAEAQCTGDPRNCDACRNDTFGQEFCENFFHEEEPAPPRPQPRFWKTDDDHEEGDGDGMDVELGRPELIMACCGDSKLCGHQLGGCTGDVIGIGGLIPGLDEAQAEKETVRVDQAWRTLKAHPNAKFASLAFLADLVAQRAPSRPGTPQKAAAKDDSSVRAPARPEGGSGSGSRPPHNRALIMPQHSLSAGISGLGIESPGSSPAPPLASALGSQSQSDRKGKRKVVETSAVRDALKALDEVDEGGEGEGRKRLRME